jgi:hypothetical protein
MVPQEREAPMSDELKDQRRVTDKTNQILEKVGGVDGVKSKASGFVGQVKKGFHPDPDKTGFKALLSRVTNLWLSGVAGKVVIILVVVFVVGALAPKGKESERQQQSASASDVRSKSTSTADLLQKELEGIESQRAELQERVRAKSGGMYSPAEKEERQQLVKEAHRIRSELERLRLDPTGEKEAKERRLLNALYFGEIRTSVVDGTSTGRDDYIPTVIGKEVRWWGRLVEVEKEWGKYRVVIDMDIVDPEEGEVSVPDVSFTVAKDMAPIKDRKGTPIKFAGKIKSVEKLLGSCQIEITDVTVCEQFWDGFDAHMWRQVW